MGFDASTSASPVPFSHHALLRCTPRTAHIRRICVCHRVDGSSISLCGRFHLVLLCFGRHCFGWTVDVIANGNFIAGHICTSTSPHLYNNLLEQRIRSRQLLPPSAFRSVRLDGPINAGGVLRARGSDGRRRRLTTEMIVRLALPYIFLHYRVFL